MDALTAEVWIWTFPTEISKVIYILHNLALLFSIYVTCSNAFVAFNVTAVLGSAEAMPFWRIIHQCKMFITWTEMGTTFFLWFLLMLSQVG